MATLKPKVDKYLPADTRLTSSVVLSGGQHFALVRVDPHPEVIAPFEADGVYRDDNGKEKIAFRRGDVFIRDGTRSQLADIAAIRAARSRIVEQAREEARAEFEQALAAVTERFNADAARGRRVDELDRKALTESLLAELRTELAAPVSARTYLRLLADGEALRSETETAGNANYRTMRDEEPSGTALDDYRRREREWLDDCERVLEPVAFAEIARARARPNTGYFAISTRMEARMEILRRLSEANVELGADPMTLVRRALSAGLKLRTRVLHENPDGGVRPLDTDPLFAWAKQTWRMLADRLPEHSDAFYGESPVLGSGHFATAFMGESSRSRSDYLEARLALLRRIAARGA